MLQSSLSRRNFLKSLVLGATLLLPQYSTAQETTLPPLTQLVQTDLPQEIRNSGFRIKENNKKDSEKDVIIIGENHAHKNVKVDELKLLEFLVREYKPDSIGLEGFWGEINPNNSGNYFNEFYGEDLLSKVKAFPFKSDVARIRERGNWTLIRERGNWTLAETLERYYPGLANLARRNNIRLYGIEDKDTLLKAQSLDVLAALVEQLNNQIRYRTPENLAKAEELYNKLREPFPDLAFIPKGTTFREYLEIYQKNPADKSTGLKAARFVIDYSGRNQAFAKNIQDYTKKFNSKRSLVITGYGHVVNNPFQDIKAIQSQIPYSSVIIATPGTKPVAYKNGKVVYE